MPIHLKIGATTVELTHMCVAFEAKVAKANTKFLEKELKCIGWCLEAENNEKEALAK